MRPALPMIVLTLVATPAQAAKPMVSWGKPGVTLDAYRADAVDCGIKGAFHDVSKTEPAQAVIAAEEWNDRNLNMPMAGAGMNVGEQHQRMIQRFRPEQRLAQVQTLLVTQTERCLFDRGYHPFRLTKAQEKALRRLKPGTPARHAYLHGLAADPAVLQAQQTLPDAK